MGIMTAAWEDPRIARGMQAQLRLRRERLSAGQESLGWKLAFGGPAARERLCTQAPLVGFLLRRALLPSGSTVSISDWTKPAAEPEIAVHLGKDLPADSDRSTVRAAISGLAPAIELADVDHPAEDVEGTLARDIYQRHVLLGSREVTYAGGGLAGLTGRVLRNGSGIADMADAQEWQALTGELVDNVRHVARLLAAFGESLRAGEIILSGSLTPPLWVAPGEEIVFHLTPIDTVCVRFAP